MRWAIALLEIYLLAASASGQEIPLELKGDTKIFQVDRVIVVKDDLTVVSSFPLDVRAPAGSGLYFWSVPAGVQSVDKGDVLQVTGAPNGMLTISVKAISPKLDKDGRFLGFVTTHGSVSFSVGAPTPVPPTPVPPDPVPPPSPAPIPLPGLRVLIIFEEMDAEKLPPAQLSVLYAAPMRTYLDSVCVMGPDGKTPESRIFDKDAPTDKIAKHWQDAMKRPRASLPWIIVSDGVVGFEGPLPANTTETIAVIEKIAKRKGAGR